MSILDNADRKTHKRSIVKLSSKGRYGVRALFDIAFFHRGGPTQVKEIASRQAIPPRFLEQIFQDLKRAGIVSSKRGPQGGYRLAQAAEEIGIGNVVRALEGPVLLHTAPALEPPPAHPISPPLAPCSKKTQENEETGPSNHRASGPGDSSIVSETVLGELSQRLEDCLNTITIADLCTRAESMGFRSPQAKGYVYKI